MASKNVVSAKLPVKVIVRINPNPQAPPPSPPRSLPYSDIGRGTLDTGVILRTIFTGNVVHKYLYQDFK